MDELIFENENILPESSADNNFQLEINFSENSELNRFQNTLDNGDFVMLIEHNSVELDNDFEIAKERLAQLEEVVLNIKSVNAALAITDSYASANCYKSIDYAMGLSPDNRDRHVIYLSGRNSSLDDMKSNLSLAQSGKFKNIVAVTGDSVFGEGVRATQKRTFLESVHTLQLIRRNYANLFFDGCVMNPFQYTPYTLFPQYSKLVKKLNAGAKFIVTQAGYDMLKLQALRWYLGERGLFFPTIARLIFLSPEIVEAILDKRIPGIKISNDFKKILDKELQFSRNQFESAQWRRLELQAAGCRLLGYSGVQIMGIDTPTKIKSAADRIAGALREFSNFEQWLEEYNAYLAKVDMAPISGSFYMYDRVLRRSYPETPPRISEFKVATLTNKEKILYNLRKFMFHAANKQNSQNRRFWKILLANCRTCRNCRLPHTFYVCPEHCPKKSANGPCGGVKANGDCELGNFECIHSYMTRLAMWKKEVNTLEDDYLPIEGIDIQGDEK
ncbi:MAG: methylenetetrahydrofolate reductase C-terminal domain-containing protein [Lentisphaeria bacterium]|nr:methylenetetrahydrofolate reductase C-terminal domain-containing protein [Lentisphaeria bacterium]